jgi:hypothetical protein
MRSSFRSLTLSVLPAFFLASVAAAPAQEGSSKPIVIQPSYHDVSPPLRDMVAAAPFEMPTGQHIIPLRPTPPLPGAGAAPAEDRVLQTLTLPLVGTINGLNFDGVSANGFAPPDTNGSVGTTQFVQITNVEYAVYDKSSGTLLLGPALIHTIWTGFGGDCETSGDGGDPIVVFDKAAQRWVVSQLSGSYNSWCMAVSQTSDATGSYFRYAFSSGGNLDDYPKLGVWPDAYYRSTNTFSGGFVGANACAFDRALMLTGGAANEICFQQNSSAASLLPSDLDGSTAPPSGEPNLFIELLSTSSLGLFKFHVDFTTPANSTFTGPTTISVASYSEACGGGTCIPQSGTTQQLDSLGDRLMFRNAYRNLNGTEYLVVAHSVTAGTSVGARWYQITNPNGTPTVAQQGTFAPDSTYRWMGSIAMDQAGDIALGYSASSSSIHPAIRYTGRVPSDPSGMMESEDSIIEGTGSQTSGLSRWGDYSSMGIDPVDDCTFWYTTEYIPTNGTFNWHTRIGSFKFNGCGGPPTPDFSLSASPFSQTVVQGKSTTYTVTVTPLNGYNKTVTLSVSSGCPTGATCTLNPTSSSPPSYPPSTLTVQTTSSTPGGTYAITIKGTDGTLTHTTSVSLTVVVPDFSISSNPTSTSIKRGGTAKYTETLKSVNTFSGSVMLSATGCPPSSTCSFSPNPVSVPSGGSATSTFSVATKSTTPTGTYTMTLTGTSGSLKHSVTVQLRVTKH